MLPDVGVFSANTILPATFAARAAVARQSATFTGPRRRRRRSPAVAGCATVGAAPTVCSARQRPSGDLGSDSEGRAKPSTATVACLGLKNAFPVAAAEGHGPRLSISFRAAGRAISTTTAHPLVVPTSANSGPLFCKPAVISSLQERPPPGCGGNCIAGYCAGRGFPAGTDGARAEIMVSSMWMVHFSSASLRTPPSRVAIVGSGKEARRVLSAAPGHR